MKTLIDASSGPRERRCPSLDTVSQGTLVTSIDIDLTVACNLRCVYCFKEKWNEHMPERVAFDALVWLLHASGPVKKVHVNFMGGEPLVRFSLIKKIVPFGRRRAWQMGKNMTFGATVNGTLVTDEVVDFWRQWGMVFIRQLIKFLRFKIERSTASGGEIFAPRGTSVPRYWLMRLIPRHKVMVQTGRNLIKNFHYFRCSDIGKLLSLLETSKWDSGL